MIETRRLWRRWPLTLFVCTLAGCASTDLPKPGSDAASIQGDIIRFGAWVLGCSNQRVCTAITPLRGNHAAEDAVHMRIVFQTDIADPQSIAIARNGEQLEALSPLAVHLLQDDLHRRTRSPATFQSERGIRYMVPRNGFVKVMQALAKWRTRPSHPLNSADAVTPFPATRIDDPGIPQTLSNVARRCPKGHMGQSLQSWAGIDGSRLWRAGCGNEGLNPISFWFTSGPQGATLHPVDFDGSGGSVNAYNSWFQDSSGYLRMTHYFGGFEDCGIYRAFAWVRGSMKLLETRVMPHCGTGIGAKDWIETYRAIVLNGPDTGP